MKRTLSLLFIALLGLVGAADAAERYRVAWSHYTGWEPWGYADHAGILKKWADKYGIEIELTLVNDYIESINLYTSGQFDACTMTNMDALTIPAVGGVDSTALIVGDFSNGNDGIVMKNGKSVADLKGRTVNLVELSVSHYMLARALDMNGLSERDVTLVNTSDADIAALFASDPNGAVVTWNPPLQQVRNVQGAELVFDSSKIPGEIIDLMVVKTDAPDSLKKALVGAWYEIMAVMSGTGNAAKEAIEYMAGGRRRHRGGVQGPAAHHRHVLSIRPRRPTSPAAIRSRRPWTMCANSPSTRACTVRGHRRRFGRHLLSGRHGRRRREQREAAL